MPMITPYCSPEATLRDHLLRARHRDGGWGYEPGCVPRLEPTCWALLALQKSRSTADRVLAHWPSVDGALVEQPGGLVNWSFHALALSTRITLGDAFISELKRLAGALIDARGTAPHQPAVQADTAGLRGWSWIDGTFSRIEPMAWALLALKQCRARGVIAASIDRQIRKAEAILEQRMCPRGGWNDALPTKPGSNLPGYVPTTAIALLALQDRHDKLFVRLSRNRLEQQAESHPSIRALALSMLALKRHRGSTHRIEDQLRRYIERDQISDAASIGMALCALNGSAADAFAF